MNVGELKKFLRNSTAVLVVEDDQPAFVAINYEMYKKMIERPVAEVEPVLDSPLPRLSRPLTSRDGGDDLNGSATSALGRENKPSAGEMELIERINKDILALKEEIENEEKVVGDTAIDEVK